MVWLALFLAAVLAVVVFVMLSPGTSSTRVLLRYRANGVHPSLQALLDAWELEGSHIVLVAPDGGFRTDAAKQASYAATGTSNAGTLQSTPHGRGAALDLYPADFIPFIKLRWEQVPELVRAKFQTFGQFAEDRGFTWGGRWRSEKFPNGDQPHVEVKGWRNMPFPVPGGAY